MQRDQSKQLKRREFIAAAAAVIGAGFFEGLPARAYAGVIKPTMPQSRSAPLARLDYPLPHVAVRLAAGDGLKIVALGSSSTEGIGASSPGRSYPARLNAYLRARYPDIAISVRNEGVGGEDAKEMLARFDRVIAEKPDLVIWQVGTNAVLEGLDLVEQARLIQAGLDRLMSIDADVVLIDPQYTPHVVGKPNAVRMVELIESLGQQSGIGVFHRFAVMRHWRTVQHLPFGMFTSHDGLHLNDWSYDRIAQLLAGAISEASVEPLRTVGARSTGKPRSQRISAST
jgi:acyl-CoA thioesterase-1